LPTWTGRSCQAAGLDLAAREALVGRLASLAVESTPEAIVLVTHHLEEIPAGFGHSLVMADGRVVAAGPIRRALTSTSLSRAYGVSLDVRHRTGRFTAIARP
jgi:iron complex transport system ATP-binding protein